MIRDAEALAERARNLGACNGIRRVRVTLDPPATPMRARLYMEFHNDNGLADLLAAVTPDPDPDVESPPWTVFPLAGGHRLPAGPLPHQVRVTGVSAVSADAAALELVVEPVGDYSTYTLSIDAPAGVCIDPVLGEIGFRFRPGCFNLCGPDWEPPRAAVPGPAIDYVAKDYDSFRHQAIAWMMDRVPGWQLTSEADLDVVLLELFSAAADELSDYQDRVMNEAYLATARRRVSLARHARLMDYHVHQGSQAGTWLALDVSTQATVTAPFVARTLERETDPGTVVFVAPPEPADRPARVLHPLLNRAALYTWSDGIPALEEGSVAADLAMPNQVSADLVAGHIRAGAVKHLLIEELLNPRTGRLAGRNARKRQLLALLPGDEGAETVRDPVLNAWVVRVRWADEDALRARYCFVIGCRGTRVDGVSCFRGNLLPAFHGRPEVAVFHEPDALLPFPEPLGERHLHYERGLADEALCPLPSPFVAYRGTPPGGETPPQSTVEVEIGGDPWDEVPWLVFSTDGGEKGDHFVLETDEEGNSLLRFGDGVNGRRVPDGEAVRCAYQVGRGLDGNVGAESLRFWDPVGFPEVTACRNPRDVTDGRAPEPADEVVRRAPEAFRKRQLRAVTLADYRRRAEEVSGVSRAAAAYLWTGSWRAVRVTIDPVGGTTLDEALAADVLRHLDAVRLVLDDVEVRGPEFVPLRIEVAICVHPSYWPRDVRDLLEQEFSTGYAPDGSPAFFHPDRWTFGQPLRASEILGRAQRVEGVHHVGSIDMRRLYDTLPVGDLIKVGPSQIVRVENDPDHRERGSILFIFTGGRG